MGRCLSICLSIIYQSKYHPPCFIYLFHCLLIVNNTAMSMSIQIALPISAFISLGIFPEVFNALGIYDTVFHGSWCCFMFPSTEDGVLILPTLVIFYFFE